MHVDDEQQHLFTRRTMVLGGVKGTLLLSLVGRMFSLQVLNQEHYQNLSDKNRIYKSLIVPDRGLIVDRRGIILADNKNTYFAQFDRDQVKDITDLIDRLKIILKLDEEEIEYIYKQIRTKSRIEQIVIRNNIPWEMVARLELSLQNLPGVSVEKVRTRFYSHGEEFVHVIGYVAAVNNDDRAKTKDPLLRAPGFRIGKTGLEKQYEKLLRGREGYKQVEVNATRRIVRTLSIDAPEAGETLELNIDLALQKRVYKIMEPILSGSCIVMDVHTGAIRALVSYPGFDGNLFVNRISHAGWNKLSSSIYRPLVNKAIHGTYSPGSTFKMITALSALENGVVAPYQKFFCPGHYNLGKSKFHCWTWRRGGHGYVDLKRALKESCDVYFYNLATRLTSSHIAETAKKFGLGSKCGIEILGEKSGLVPTPEWKENYFQSPWTQGDTVNISIGQGALTSTPLQLAKMTAMIANGGMPIEPRILKSEMIEVHEKVKVDPYHLKLIRLGMQAAVNDVGGTGFRAKLSDKNWQLCGKTGSTQVSRITKKQRQDGTLNDRPWHLKEHALFTGYAPHHKPKYAVVVLVEHGGGGGRVAAPVAKEVMNAVKEILK